MQGMLHRQHQTGLRSWSLHKVSSATKQDQNIQDGVVGAIFVPRLAIRNFILDSANDNQARCVGEPRIQIL